MPAPNPNESESDYLSRCIPDLLKEGRSQDQAAAICYSMYREAQGHAKSKVAHEQKNRGPE